MNVTQDQNTGLIEPTISPSLGKQYVSGGLGGVPKLILKPDRVWKLAFAKEEQFRGPFDSANCVAFNIIKAIQRLEYEQTGVWVNYSDRWLGTIAGNTGLGMNPHDACEAIRKYGLVREETMPWTPDLIYASQYYSFKGVDEAAARKEGQEWLKKWDFLHEWVFDWTQTLSIEKRQELMMESLQYSPLGIAVSAWKLDPITKTYIDNNTKNNHWTDDVGVEPIKFWLVDDSYLVDDSPFKEVDWKHNITYVKRYYMVPKVFTPEVGNWIQRLLDGLKQMLADLIGKNPPPIVPPVSEPVVTPKPLSKAEVKKIITDIANAMGVDPKLACAVAQCESSFVTNARRVNSPTSIDRGIYQWNSHYHPHITDEMADDPKTATRLFCQAVLDGKLDLYWSASKPCWSKLV